MRSQPLDSSRNLLCAPSRQQLSRPLPTVVSILRICPNLSYILMETIPMLCRIRVPFLAQKRGDIARLDRVDRRPHPFSIHSLQVLLPAKYHAGGILGGVQGRVVVLFKLPHRRTILLHPLLQLRMQFLHLESVRDCLRALPVPNVHKGVVQQMILYGRSAQLRRRVRAIFRKAPRTWRLDHSIASGITSIEAAR
jgi:hypothetical protein